MPWGYSNPLPLSPSADDAAGEIRAEGNAVETVISTASADFSNKVQVTIFTENGPAVNATPEYANSRIVVIENHMYELAANCSILGGTNVIISMALFKNSGAVQLSPRITRKVSALDVGAASLGGLANLVAGDTVELWVQNETNNDNITIQDSTFFIHSV